MNVLCTHVPGTRIVACVRDAIFPRIASPSAHITHYGSAGLCADAHICALCVFGSGFASITAKRECSKTKHALTSHRSATTSALFSEWHGGVEAEGGESPRVAAATGVLANFGTVNHAHLSREAHTSLVYFIYTWQILRTLHTLTSGTFASERPHR